MRWNGLPPHWWFNGPQRRARPAGDLFRDPNVAGAHVATFRRLIRIGPVGLYVMRYRPGSAPERGERIP